MRYAEKSERALTETAATGMPLVEQYYRNYGSRARELKKQGNKIIGYLCAFVPLEIISAAGFVPIRIKGESSEPIARADALMETIVCPMIRSCFDMSLQGNFEFLDGLVIPHACDSICRTYEIWKYSLGLPFSHFINMPHGTDDSSLKFFKEELKTFKKSIGRFAGRNIPDDDLLHTVRIYNEYRAKVRQLFELRKSTPPLISGTEVAKVLIAALGIPVTEGLTLVDDVITEVKQRASGRPKLPRIMVVGAHIDDCIFIQVVEDSGAYVVTDDLCPGDREYRTDVAITADPLDGIAERYLRGINCARTYIERQETYQEYLDKRFGHIRDAIRDFSVEGVILYMYKYCDPFGFEVPAKKAYIESLGTPVLYLEDELTGSATSRLKIRVQAFLEMLAGKGAR